MFIVLTATMHAGAQPEPRVTPRSDQRVGDGSTTMSHAPLAGSPFSNALRIARMLRDDRLVARLLAMRAVAKGTTEADLRAVVDADERAGMTNVAIDFLRDRIRRFPDEPRTRVLLAHLLARSGQSQEAVAAWEDQIAKFGFDALSPDEGHAYARHVSRTGNVDLAYAVLLRLLPKMSLDANEYWLDLATLAWDRDDSPVALRAYDNLYRLEPKTLYAGARLMALLAEADRHDDAVRIAMAEHRRTGDPSAVLFAGHLRANDGNWFAVKAIIDEAEQSPGALHDRAEYFLLRGDCAKHLGDLPGAWAAYRAALALAPDDSHARASVLSTALERGDDLQTHLCVTSWRDTARAEPPLWAPMGQALARFGRHKEAALFFALQLRSSARDGRTLLDFAGALEALGRHSLGDELRRRAVIGLSKETAAAVQNRTRSADDLQLIESAALTVRTQSGAAEAEKWMSILLASAPASRARVGATRTTGRFAGASADRDELAVDWYLSTGRPEFARRILLARAPHELRRYRLAVALLDGNHAQLKGLLEDPRQLTAEDRVHALVSLERDRDAIDVLNDTLARSPNSRDEPALRDELARLAPFHRPNVRVGATYLHVTGLDVMGPTLSATHDAFGGRLTYAATGARMTDRSGLLALQGDRYEAEAGVLLRLSWPRGVTDLGAGLGYQVGTPVARASFLDQRLLTTRLGLTTDVRAGDRIVDTSFLRVAGVRNSVSVGLRYDLARWYISAEIEGREDQTRRYEHLAWDVIGSAETGLTILTREPHLSVGVQGQASQREYRTRMPDELTTLLSPRVDPARALPPSFQLAGGVIHLSRGDVSERYRPDRKAFPRYDCEAAFGVLLPAPDTALHVLCAASIRAPGGYTSLLAFYNRGIAGVRNNENAELALSYTLPF